jgi:hypothetical protein
MSGSKVLFNWNEPPRKQQNISASVIILGDLDFKPLCFCMGEQNLELVSVHTIRAHGRTMQYHQQEWRNLFLQTWCMSKMQYIRSSTTKGWNIKRNGLQVRHRIREGGQSYASHVPSSGLILPAHARWSVQPLHFRSLLKRSIAWRKQQH